MSSVQFFRNFINERLTAAAEEILIVFEKTIVQYEEEIDRQRTLMDIVLKPDSKLHQQKSSQLSDCNEEDVTDQQLCIQERSSSLDQEEPEPPEIKDEQEHLCISQEREQLELKQKTDTFMLRPICHNEDQTLYSNPLPQTNISTTIIGAESDQEGLGVLEPNSDHHLPHNSHKTANQDHTRGNQENASSDQEPENKHLKCLYCNEEFDDFLKLEIHMRTHTGEKCFESDICGKGFTQKALVRNMTTHTGVKPFRCRVCGRDFNCQSHCDTHMKTHTGEKPHTCVTCGKAFNRSADLKRHTRTHTGEKPYSCVHCGRRFSYHSSLTNHVRLHTGEKPYECIWCGKVFAVSTTLKIHTRVHTGEKPYTCNICGRNFAQNTGLRFHRRIHARETQQN